ncbi:hypothetical protein SCA6_000922 [Theobroma cacao]
MGASTCKADLLTGEQIGNGHRGFLCVSNGNEHCCFAPYFFVFLTRLTSNHSKLTQRQNQT